MTKIFEKSLFAVAILAVLCAYLFFFKLGAMALTDPDEAFYAQTAKEMLNRGEWHTPYLYDKPQFEKPILIYWLIEASYKAFGVNETAARLPSAIFGLLGVIAIYLLASELFNRRAGFLAAIILATNVEYIILSRACVTDMVLTSLMIMGVLFFFLGYLREKKYFYILSSAVFALAVLAKGPIAMILPGAVFVLFLIFAKDKEILKKIPWIPATLVFVLIAAPWYILAYKMHGRLFTDAFFGFHNITRFMQSEHKIGSQYYYNIPIIMGGFLPWSVFIPFGFWHAFKKAFGKDRIERNKYIFILVWFFAIFIFFSISSTKLPTYIFPSFLSLALIVAALWDDFLKYPDDRAIANGVKFSYYILPIAILAGAAGAAIYIHGHMGAILIGVIFSSAILGAGIIISASAFANRMPMAAFFMIPAALAIFLYPLSSLVLPEVERYEASKEVAGKLLTMMAPEDALGSQSNYLPGLAFYANKMPVDIDKHQAMVDFFNSKKRVWAVIKAKNHRALYNAELNSDYVRPSYLLYSVGKRAIVTNELPKGASYITMKSFEK